MLFGLGLVLAGCSTRQMEPKAETAPPPGPVHFAQTETHDWEGDTLIAQNHLAADGMIANLENRLPREARILGSTFVNRDNFDESSSLGRLLASQFTTRLSQAGFGVMEIRLRSELGIRVREGEFALSRKTAQYMRQNFDASAILVGDYTVDDRAVFVSARLVRLDTGVVVAAYDYAVPNRGAVARLLDDHAGDVAFAQFLRERTANPAMDSGSGMDTGLLSPLPLQEIPLVPPVDEGGPTEVPGPFRLFPPNNLQ